MIERNPDFTKDVAEKVPTKSKIIVVCSRGELLRVLMATEVKVW